VFDFDGVILESADVKTNAFVDLFAEHGPDIVAGVRAHHLANLGISRFKKFAWIYENLLGRVISSSESEELGRRFGDLALTRVLEAPFVPGAREALVELDGALPMFVASGTPQEELDLIVDRRGLRSHFREVWGAPAEKPAILRDLMSRHGLRPDEIVFVGDGMSDYKAARAVEVQFLARDTPDLHDEWVALGVRRRPDLSDFPATVRAW
jgi:phosphoglycolate phosphatase-like HAD superfamily hydrolase